jgi:hypothetical protein
LPDNRDCPRATSREQEEPAASTHFLLRSLSVYPRNPPITLSPVLFGSGIRLFEGVDAGRVALEPVRAEPTERVTHLTYAVRER